MINTTIINEETGMLDMSRLTGATLAKTIDHSLLKPELTERDVDEGCALAARYHVASVCVKPCHVALAVRLLAGTDVLVGTVIGFPHGSSTTATKAFEARQALDDGAVELDMECVASRDTPSEWSQGTKRQRM